jgi:nitrilase
MAVLFYVGGFMSDENQALAPVIACVQMVSGTSVLDNLTRAAQGILQAVQKGAQIVVLPEYFCLMGAHDGDKLAIAEPFNPQPEPQHAPIQAFLREQAMAHGVYLIGGTIALRSADATKVLNTCLVYAPSGALEARYDKIHLFGFQNGAESYAEADTIEAGGVSQNPIWQSPWGNIGLAVCYDLRFPEFFRKHNVLAWVLVAAFTHTTGRAHWGVLLRARAIENQCYVVACGQGGLHENGRHTFGHSMVIDAWGVVQTELSEGAGVVIAPLPVGRNERVRTSLPALQHRVIFS